MDALEPETQAHPPTVARRRTGQAIRLARKRLGAAGRGASCSGAAVGQGTGDLAIMLVAVRHGAGDLGLLCNRAWTRDGSVRVQVASVAPQVSGQIVELRAVDNQFVHKGTVVT